MRRLGAFAPGLPRTRQGRRLVRAEPSCAVSSGESRVGRWPRSISAGEDLPVAVRIAGILLGWCSRTAGTVELGLEGERLLFVGISKGAYPGLPFSNGHFLRRAAFLRRLTHNANDLRG